MQNGIVRFRTASREHTLGDVSCSGCEPLEGENYPRLHKNVGGNCLGLVHAEVLPTASGEGQTILWCEACYRNLHDCAHE
jgi:hypothetical protein